MKPTSIAGARLRNERARGTRNAATIATATNTPAHTPASVAATTAPATVVMTWVRNPGAAPAGRQGAANTGTASNAGASAKATTRRRARQKPVAASPQHN